MEEQEKFYHYEQPKVSLKRRKKRLFIAWAVLLPVFLIVGYTFFKVSNVLTIAGSDAGTYKNFKVEKESDRLDVLVLGIGGAGHEGALLSDTMILLSFNKKTGETAMVSLPRDLLVEMPGHPRPEKINYAYALGEQRVSNGGGLMLSKEVVKYITGVYIDHAAVLNFTGFERLIDIFGGVTIYRQTPFVESRQWQGEGNPNSKFWRLVKEEPAPIESSDISQDSLEDSINNSENSTETPNEYWEFFIPAGTHVLNGEEALYYARSRYSTNDFDRANRQQEIITSLEQKASALNIITNPVKVFDILNVLGDNVRTDMSLGDIREVISLVDKYGNPEIIGERLDTSEDGLLESRILNDGRFVLIPKAGDNDFTEIREFFKNIFN